MSDYASVLVSADTIRYAGEGKGTTHLEGSKVNDTVDRRMRLEDLVEGAFLSEVGLVEDGPLAADGLDAVEGDLGGVVEVVYDDDLIAMLEEGEGGEGPDVSSTTIKVKS